MTLIENPLTGSRLTSCMRLALRVVLGVLVGLILLLSALLMLLNDAHYRDALIWSADYFLDSQLEINDAFALRFGRDLVLTAEAVRLRANDGSYDVAIGAFDGSLRLGSYLRTGSFWVHRLLLDDIRIEIVATDNEAEEKHPGISIPSFVIETVQLKNLSLVYTQSEHSKQHTLTLSELIIDEVQDQGPIKVKAGAVLNARAFTIDGTLGSLAQINDLGQPYPVDVRVSSESFTARVSGSIDDPVNGEGLALQLRINDPEFGRTLNTFYKNIPVSGHLTLTANLGGDYSAPRLENIDIALQQSREMQMTLRGEIAELTQMKGARFDASVKAATLAELSPLLGSDLPELGAVDASAILTMDGERLNVDDIQLTIGAMDKPVVSARGSVHSMLSANGRAQFDFNVVTAELIRGFNEQSTPHNLGDLKGYLSAVIVDDGWMIEKINLISTNTDLYQLNIDGAVNDLQMIKPFGLSMKLDAPDPSIIGESLGLDFSGFASTHFSGELSGNRNKLGFQGKMRIGKTDTELQLETSLTDGRPLIQGKLTMPVLYLSDIGITPGLQLQSDTSTQQISVDKKVTPQSTDKTGLQERQTLFSAEALNVALLQGFNLKLAVLVDQISGADYAIDRLEGQVRLMDGTLRISPMHLVFEGGVTDVDLAFKTANTPEFSFKVTADDLKLGQLIAQVQQEVPVEGYANLQIDINAHGRSAHEMASSLSGKLSFSLENARVPRRYIEYLSVDVFGWALRSATFTDPYAQLDCVMAGFDIEQGVAKSRLMIADGPNLSIEGRTTLDLGQETIDMVLLPKQKKSIYSNMSAVNVTGRLLDPDVQAISMQTAATKIGALVLVPGVAIPFYLIDKVWKHLGDDDGVGQGCSEFISKYQAK